MSESSFLDPSLYQSICPNASFEKPLYTLLYLFCCFNVSCYSFSFLFLTPMISGTSYNSRLLFVVAMSFLMLSCMQSLRLNMSVTIVCMVNRTSLGQDRDNVLFEYETGALNTTHIERKKTNHLISKVTKSYSIKDHEDEVGKSVNENLGPNRNKTHVNIETSVNKIIDTSATTINSKFHESSSSSSITLLTPDVLLDSNSKQQCGYVLRNGTEEHFMVIN